MFFKPLDLTTALRPSLLPEETLLFLQDAVGLYEGKYKIPNYQNGHAYLTSHRICYVAVDEPRQYCLAIELRDCDRADYQAGFLKSSPKIVIYPKPSKTTGVSGSLLSQRPLQAPAAAPAAAKPPLSRTWICAICSFSNPVPSNFDPTTATAAGDHLPPCLACGIKPPFTTILKAAISAAASQGTQPAWAAPVDSVDVQGSAARAASQGANSAIACPRCTFMNHPYLLECEICGAPLASAAAAAAAAAHVFEDRSGSPAPFFGQGAILNTEVTESIKLSFRDGGEKIFYEKLKGALIQRKWLLQNAPPVPPPSTLSTATATATSPLRPQSPSSGPSQAPLAAPSSTTTTTSSRSPGAGITGLERRGLETRQNNEAVIGSAFVDLEALMASAKQIVSLAEMLARDSGMASSSAAASSSTTTTTTSSSSSSAAATAAVLSESAAALGMVTTKDMLSSSADSSLYLSQLSRDLAEYLTDDCKGILHREGGIMSLIDLWALFNRARNGVELISPADFHSAAEMWDRLQLPVRLRRFKTGLLVVQSSHSSDDKTLLKLERWLDELARLPVDADDAADAADAATTAATAATAAAGHVTWDWRRFGRPITAQQASLRFKWSVGVAAEELEMAEDRGLLCREEGIEGLRFWRNAFL